jgi:hypothetical protein
VVVPRRAPRGGWWPLAFGFVYIHPFADGNGRLHHWLIHHVLANAGFNPPALVFPISTAILRQLEKYLAVLQSYSGRLLNFIEWKPAAEGNGQVLNDTADYYRYFDATAHAEFLSMNASSRPWNMICRMRSCIYRPMIVSVTPSKTTWICRIKRSICFGTFCARAKVCCAIARVRMNFRP